MTFDPAAYTTPVTLKHDHVRLQPMRREDAAALWAAAAPRLQEVWQFLGNAKTPGSEADMREHVDDALEAQSLGLELPFTVFDAQTERVIGTTRFLDISVQHRHVEIGWTWYAPEYWRTSVNTECKYLLLRHAFEAMGCIRVQLRTDERNERSRRAIERIGGVLEGVIRKDRLQPSGWQRSSAQYSLIAEEWPARKAWFEATLARPSVGAAQ